MSGSFLEDINIPDDGFGIDNLPYGVFSPPGTNKKHLGVAIGSYILDLNAAAHLFSGPLMKEVAKDVFSGQNFNKFLELECEYWFETRKTLKLLLNKETGTLKDLPDARKNLLHKRSDCTMHLPIDVGDYTDFYASIDHARNVGTIMRGPDNALMPNYTSMPIAYHGRASSVCISGTSLVRPSGQRLPPNSKTSVFSPSVALDFELEMGIVIGSSGNCLGQPIRMSETERYIFGLVLLNDWSARDIQKWEYQPLGPFLAKNFGTTISPWIVPMEALIPFKVSNREQDPTPLPYLQHDDDYNFDINLEVDLLPKGAQKSKVICKSNFKHLYWSAKQMVAHHTVSGCNLRPGDLFGTGTISGPTAESSGSLLELTQGGKQPIKFEDGIERTYLQDGDTVTIRGYCQNSKGAKISFGSCAGRILPADIAKARPSICVSRAD